MVVGSGYLDVNGIHNVGKIVSELKRREIGINDIKEERIMFNIERETIDAIKNEIASMGVLDDVKNVRLTYYSVENR